MRSCGRSPRITRRRSSTIDRRVRGLAATFYHAQSAFEVRGLTRPRSEDIVPERYQEHHVADLLLKGRCDLAASNDQWSAKLKVLKESLAQHIHEEDRSMSACESMAFLAPAQPLNLPTVGRHAARCPE